VEVFWTILIFGFLLAYAVGYLYLSNKLSHVTDNDPGVAHSDVSVRTWTVSVSRLNMQRLLGAVWLIDGLLQLKPQMFTSAFLQQVVLPMSQGQPQWLAAMVKWGASLELPQMVLWNTLFAFIQMAIGLALVVNFRAKKAIIVSLVWSLFVWVFGEGAGQLLTGQSLLISGAPGAVLIYGLLGIVIYPRREAESREWSNSSIRVAQVSFALLLMVGAVLHLQAVYLTPTGLSQAVALPWLAKSIGTGGIPVSMLLAAIELGLGLMMWWKIQVRLAMWTSVVLFFLYWWMGQGFGQIAQPLATDFNSGLVMMLLAICCQPELVRWQATQPLQQSTVHNPASGH